MQAGDAAKARQLWTEVSKGPAKGYMALSLMHLGAFAIEENKPAEAVKLFDQAAEAAPDPMIGDAARLKSAFAILDTYTELGGAVIVLHEVEGADADGQEGRVLGAGGPGSGQSDQTGRAQQQHAVQTRDRHVVSPRT